MSFDDILVNFSKHLSINRMLLNEYPVRRGRNDQVTMPERLSDFPNVLLKFFNIFQKQIRFTGY